MAEEKLTIEARGVVRRYADGAARLMHTIERLRSDVQTLGLAFEDDGAMGAAIERVVYELSDIEDALYGARIEAARRDGAIGAALARGLEAIDKAARA